MMTENCYFPLQLAHLDSDNVYRLRMMKGMKGFGVYMLLLSELRTRDGFRCATDLIPKLARDIAAKPSFVHEIIFEFDLFERESENERTYFYSPYLRDVMQNYVAKKLEMSKKKKEQAVNAPRNADGTFCRRDPLEEERREEERREEEVEEKEETPLPPPPLPSEPEIPFWERCIDEAMQEEGWMEVQAMHSGIGRAFLENKEKIFQLFKEHIRIQGSEIRIDSMSEAKAYFANFMRQRTKTNLWVAEKLKAKTAQAQAEDPYRYEQRDPITGKRSYFGHPIPDDAPPRPGERVMWHEETKRWC